MPASDLGVVVEELQKLQARCNELEHDQELATLTHEQLGELLRIRREIRKALPALLSAAAELVAVREEAEEIDKEARELLQGWPGPLPGAPLKALRQHAALRRGSAHASRVDARYTELRAEAYEARAAEIEAAEAHEAKAPEVGA